MIQTPPSLLKRFLKIIGSSCIEFFSKQCLLRYIGLVLLVEDSDLFWQLPLADWWWSKKLIIACFFPLRFSTHTTWENRFSGRSFNMWLNDNFFFFFLHNGSSKLSWLEKNESFFQNPSKCHLVTSVVH